MSDKYSLSVDTKAFNKGLEAYFSKFSRKNLPSGLKKVAFALLAKIIKRNPVDLGRSRAGWYVGADRLGVITPSSGTQEEAKGRNEGDYTEKLRGNEQYIEIVNRVHYTRYLEFGHSKQAPEGMVRVSMREISQKLKGIFDA